MVNKTLFHLYRIGWLKIILILLTSMGTMFALGRLTAPVKVETITLNKQVKIPVYASEQLPAIKTNTYFNVPLSHSLQDYIYEICADENIPISLVLAMIETESGFDPGVISETDDYGLMQINSISHGGLAEQYRTSDMLNPYQNVFCGIKIIAGYIKKYHGDYNKALMAYNMGDYGANVAWEEGIISTTYSEKILDLMKTYEEEHNGK